MYTDILEKAKLLVDAINNNTEQLWETSLRDTHTAVMYYESEVEVDADDPTIVNKHTGILKELNKLEYSIKELEQQIYDADARNHPVWRELGINPYSNRCNSPFEHLDGDYDPDAGCEWWRVWWDREEIFVYIQIDYTIDGGRDWGTVTVDNWKSEEDTIKMLRDKGVDEDNELSDDYIIDEAHGLQEIVPFQDGFLIKKELGEEQE